MGRRKKTRTIVGNSLFLPVIKFLDERVGRRLSQKHCAPKEFKEGTISQKARSRPLIKS